MIDNVDEAPTLWAHPLGGSASRSSRGSSCHRSLGADIEIDTKKLSGFRASKISPAPATRFIPNRFMRSGSGSGTLRRGPA